MSRRTFTPAELDKLKREARKMAKRDDRPHVDALNRIAVREGYDSWWHLQHATATGKPSDPVAPAVAPRKAAPLGRRPGEGRPKYMLMELISQHGECRSQSQPGPAFMFACMLWTGHDGEHERFEKHWTDTEGYMPPPEELARLESGELRQYVIRDGGIFEVTDGDDDSE